MVRFLQQYDSGEGDYIHERKQPPVKTIDDILIERQKYNTPKE